MYHCTKMKFPVKDFFSKCDQIRRVTFFSIMRPGYKTFMIFIYITAHISRTFYFSFPLLLRDPNCIVLILLLSYFLYTFRCKNKNSLCFVTRAKSLLPVGYLRAVLFY